jgi:ABC-type branched-subunit amino acid transport system substrate-binding protein
MNILGRVMIAVCLLTIAKPIAADDSPDSLMAKARKLYSAQKYDSTVVLLRDYVRRHGRDPETEYIVPLLMESLARTGDSQYFDKLFSIYIRKFPSAVYLPRLYYLEGILLAQQKKYEKAIEAFSASRNSGVGGALDTLSLQNVFIICRNNLSADERSQLLEEPGLNPQIVEILRFSAVVSLDKTNQSAKAQALAQEFLAQYPRTRYRAQAQEILNRMPGYQPKGSVSVGLLAPLTGEDADIGRQIANAIQLAVNQYNQTSDLKVKLIISDTKGNLVETARITHAMLENRVPVILGPMLSKTAAVAAAMLMDKDMVMVTPTATDEGIAQLGSNIFQVNVTLGTLAKQIAGYAMERLSIREFAIIAPNTDYGKALSTQFSEEVVRRGGEVVDQELFDEGTHDFRAHFESLRIKIYQRRLDTIAKANNLPPRQVDPSRRADSLYLADSVIAIGGIFLPAEAEDVVMLAPQVFFHRIQTQLLGSNGWYSPTTLLDGKRYVNNAIFSSNFEIDTNNDKWPAFSAEYKRQFGVAPDRMIAPLGYDAANLVLKALSAAGGDNPRGVAEELLKTQGYQGVSGPISFDKNDGVNTETAVLKIKASKFVRIY